MVVASTEPNDRLGEDLAARSRLVFALPAGSDQPSGGNIYNRRLIDALMERAPVVRTDSSTALQAILGGEPGTYLFDTLDLGTASALTGSASGQSLGLLVHHLPSLEPDLPEGHPSVELEAAALPRFDFFVVTSEFTRAWLSGRGVSEDRVLVVCPALDAVHAASRRYDGSVKALAVANLLPRKDILSLLHALATLGPAPYRLRIVGRSDLDPAYAEACRDTIARSSWLGRHVSLDGPVPHDEMGRAYEAANLFVSAAKMETFGMALQEARAHGLPIVARDAGHVGRHLTDSESGRLVASAEDLAREVVALSQDAGRMSRFFDDAQRLRLQTRYSWENAAEKLLVELDRVR
jgi:glycosyltransferase involved in cell wall biosynthesis